MKQAVTSKKGFTIVELLVYIGILSILLIAFTEIFSSSLRVQLDSQSTSSLEHDAQFVITRMRYDIARATSITTPSAIGGQSGTLQIVVGGIPYTYANNSGTLTLNNSIETDSLNSNNTTISNLSFTRIGNAGGDNTIKVFFTITSTIQETNGYETKDVETTLGLRQN